MTLRSNIHPYPAMIADELAEDVAKTYAKPGELVMDPFCGTGRTLVACAAEGSRCIGVDVNPLALMIARAKTLTLDTDATLRLLERLRRPHILKKTESLIRGRKVEWFSEHATKELHTLIHHINQADFDEQTLTILSVILSATAREVSYCRKDQWKLHRLSQNARLQQDISAIEVFKRRLTSSLRDQEKPSVKIRAGRMKWILGDSTRLSDYLGRRILVDLIFSSPPYGDSRTTVQYGGISSICLDVIRNINGLSILKDDVWEIDQKGLGGNLGKALNSERHVEFQKYWNGDWSAVDGRRISSFTSDMSASISQMCMALRPGGKAVLVVGNRNVSGHTYNMELLVHDMLVQQGLTMIDIYTRNIKNKLTPYFINAPSKHNKINTLGIIPTMKYETILVAEKSM